MIDKDLTIVPVRPCTKCGATKRNKHGKCMLCRSVWSASYRAANLSKAKAAQAKWYAANAENQKIKDAAYRAANPEKLKASQEAYRAANREKVRAASNAWNAANPEKVKARGVARYAANPKDVKSNIETWRKENPARVKTTKAAWAVANPEAVRIYSHNRRARKKANGGILSKGLAAKLFKLQKGKCPCCKQPLGGDYHLDHKMPLAMGGANTDDNIQLLRAVCNMQKHTKHPVDFMQEKGFLL